MPEDPKPKAGTTTQDGGEGGDAAVKPGTPGAAGRDTAEAGKEPDYKALHLANKDKLEKFNEMEERLKAAEDELRAGRQPAADATEGLEDDIAQMQQENIELERLAKAGDVLARNQLRLNRSMIQQRQDTIDGFALQSLPKERQPAAYKLYNANRNRFRDLGEAAEYLARQDEKKELERLQKENEDLRKGKGTKTDEAEDVVRTAGRDYGITTKKAPTMTKADFDARQRQLKEAGDHRQAMKEQGELARKEIVLKDA